jgi:hypothetical protein
MKLLIMQFSPLSLLGSKTACSIPFLHLIDAIPLGVRDQNGKIQVVF